MYILVIIIIISSFVGTLIVRKLAIKKNVVDIPNERSSHIRTTPRGGGLAIAISWYIGITYLYVSENIEENLFLALISGMLLSIISLIDDVRNLNPSVRLLFQVVSASLGLYFLDGFIKIDLGFIVFDGYKILSPLGLIGIIWFINLFNFLDGIDGYAGTETIIIALGLYFFTEEKSLIILIAASAGFLILNWQPAKIFMGDVGSTLMGYNFAIFGIYFQNTEKISFFIFLIISSIFWFDATNTLFRRWRNKEKLTEAHNKHAYQRIVQFGYSHQRTVLYAIVLNLCNFICAYFAFQYSSYLLVFCLLNIIILYIVVRLIDKKKPFEKINQNN